MEKQYDSELNEYEIVSDSNTPYIKQLYWDLAIGLNKVDNGNNSLGDDPKYKNIYSTLE